MSERAEKIVWKLGSDSCTNEFGPDGSLMNFYASQFADEKRAGRQSVAVVSGIFTTGDVILSEAYRQDGLITAPMIASRGILTYYAAWAMALEEYGITSIPIFVTHHEIDNAKEGHAFHDTVEHCLKALWLPLINENPSTDDKEMKKLKYGGDCDGLAEHTGDKIEADRVVFLTDKEGLLDESGHLVKLINEENADWALSLAKGPGPKGTGGMRSKVSEAIEAAQKGRVAHIASSRAHFSDVLSGIEGTIFLPHYGESVVT